MTANANIVDLVKGTSTLVRPRFSPGLLLRDDDLTTGVDYTRDLSRLLFRSLFGCGVVCGLEVTAEPNCGKLVVTIASGVALNGIGDPIYVPKDTHVILDPSCGKPLPPALWVLLCRTEKCCAPRSTVCGCDEEDSGSVCTREQDGFEIRLVKDDPRDCACRCKEQKITDGGDPDENQCWCANPCSDCYNDHYMGECGCDACDGDCVVLAIIRNSAADTQNYGKEATADAARTNPWTVNHSVRRFVRPVLMRDPVVFKQLYPEATPCTPKVKEEIPVPDAPPPPPPPPPPAPAAGPNRIVAARVKEGSATSAKAGGAAGAAKAKQPKQK